MPHSNKNREYMIRKIILTAVSVVFLTSQSFAGSLTAAYAPEYYQQGLQCERRGDFFQAKVFYQKALLLDPSISDAGIIREKIGKINSTLGFSGSNPVSNYVAAKDQSQPETEQFYRRQSMQIIQPSAIQEEPSEVIPGRQDFARETSLGQPSFEKTSITKAQETAVTPRHKAPEFSIYYNGSEEFLQNCFSPLCEKIIFNNFGISYAKDQDFVKAEGMFKESLKIDSYFKPAKINLEILGDMRAR